MTELLIVLGLVVVWVGLLTMAIAICAAAGRADRAMAQERPRARPAGECDREQRLASRRLATRPAGRR